MGKTTGKSYEKPDNGNGEIPVNDCPPNDCPPADNGNTTCPPPSDGDCTDQQACLISADVGASVFGLDVCLDLCIGGDTSLAPRCTRIGSAHRGLEQLTICHQSMGVGFGRRPFLCSRPTSVTQPSMFSALASPSRCPFERGWGSYFNGGASTRAGSCPPPNLQFSPIRTSWSSSTSTLWSAVWQQKPRLDVVNFTSSKPR
jgi:hypothetical protein